MRRTTQNGLRGLIALCGVILTATLQGQETAPPIDSPVAASAPPPPAATTNALPATLRDPFWPIGWRPPDFGREDARGKLDGQVQWKSARQLLKITGLSRTTGGDYVAIIEGGGIVERGDVVSLEYESLIYTWRIAKITREGIFPKQLDVKRKHN